MLAAVAALAACAAAFASLFAPLRASLVAGSLNFRFPARWTSRKISRAICQLSTKRHCRSRIRIGGSALAVAAARVGESAGFARPIQKKVCPKSRSLLARATAVLYDSLTQYEIVAAHAFQETFDPFPRPLRRSLSE